MKAIILVGGFGTRIRPLSLTCPKPLIPFANKPMIMHQIEALVKVGVDHFILAVSYMSDLVREAMQDVESRLNVKIEFNLEETVLDTGGPLAVAREQLLSNGGDKTPFFVM